MSRPVIHPILLLLILGSGIMCQPERVNPPTLTGKLVIDRACSHFVIQLLQGSIEPSKIVPVWKNSANDSTYVNVFAVSNQCTFPYSGIAGGRYH